MPFLLESGGSQCRCSCQGGGLIMLLFLLGWGAYNAAVPVRVGAHNAFPRPALPGYLSPGASYDYLLRRWDCHVFKAG